MAMKGDAPMAVGIMWMLVFIALVFVVLRMYTRLVMVKMYGIDDHVYFLAFILLFLYTLFITLSAQRGFGQNMNDIPNSNDISSAILLEAIGQIFAVLGMAIAKWSLGLFLLRLVVELWHQVVIWAVMIVLMGASISLIFCFMLQCSPPAYLWDRTIKGGHCDVPMMPVSVVYAVSCVFADFFFALFPWIFIWRLQMNRREKLVILFSMSLGIIAGAFGIIRAIGIPSLMSQNYLKDTVRIILWSCAEQCVTMVCIGVLVCRPLYKPYIDRLTSSDRKKAYNSYRRQRSGDTENNVALRSFGRSNNHNRPWRSDNQTDDEVPLQRGQDLRSPFSPACITAVESETKDDTAGGGKISPDDHSSNGKNPDWSRIHVSEGYAVTRD